jgi:hypothetical protein
MDILYRTLATHITKKAGYKKQTAQTGAVTLIQRFGSALNLNIHFHMLYLDGVYAEDNYGKTRFHPIKAPTKSELNSLTHRISQRLAGLRKRSFWQVNLDCMFDGLPLWRVAQELGISITTAFRWRNRFLKAPTDNNPMKSLALSKPMKCFSLKASRENGPFITDQPESEVASAAKN